MSDCIFCNIVNKDIEAELIYEDSKIIAFNDISPIAPEHILVIPREHFSTIEDVKGSDILSHLFFKVTEIAKIRGLEDYRIIINKGEKAGQTVFHLHIHIIGGRDLKWPPG